MKCAWIASNKAHWPIALACEVLGVSASGYFEHGRRKKLPPPDFEVDQRISWLRGKTVTQTR